MGDPGEDFSDYMDKLAAREEAARERQAMYDRHEHWRQTTWGGWSIRQLQGLAKHFRPFLDEIRGILTTPDDDSILRIIIFNLIRMLAMFVLVGFIYAMSHIIQNFVGTELVQEEEIVIVHEYASEEEASKARKEQEKMDKNNTTTTTTTNSKMKKQ